MDDSNHSSDDGSIGSRKESLSDVFDASDRVAGSPESMDQEDELTGMEADMREIQAERERHEQPLRRVLRPRSVRTRVTTSTESNLDELDEMNLDEEEDEEDEDDEDGEHRELNDSNGANTSFVSANPLDKKDNYIHIGNEYQAIIETAGPEDSYPEREDRVWDCNVELDEQRLHEYVGEACGRYKISIDRALYILRKHDHDFEKAIEACARRKNLGDIWSKEEKSLFATAYFHFGKNFKKVHAVMPERCLHSIVQYYYNTKKTNNYKTNICVQLNEPDTYDELFNDLSVASNNAAGRCENCNGATDLLIHNRILKRHECKPCILYFKLMRSPRPPATIGALVGRSNSPPCPEFMKPYVNDYEMLMEPADGKAADRLGIHLERDENDPDDDECMVVDECPLRSPSPLYIVETTREQDPVDPNTCRMTRIYNNPLSKCLIENVRKKHHPCVQIVWRERQTKCMEDITLLNEAARRAMLHATALDAGLDRDRAMRMCRDIKEFSKKCNRFSPELPESSTVASGSLCRSGKLRQDSNWVESEKRDVIRCFHWYSTDFDAISEVMLTKSPEQVKLFYQKHQETIEPSVQKYHSELRRMHAEALSV